MLTADGAGGVSFSPVAGAGLFDAYAYIREEQVSGTNGGDFTSGAWRTRVLNTEVFDTSAIVSLAANQFTLGAGTYWIVGRAPAQEVNWHKLKLRNITDSTDDIIGGNAYCPAAQSGGAHAFLAGRITIAGAKVFELQHQCFTTKTTNGLGVACSFSVAEVYAEVEIWREA